MIVPFKCTVPQSQSKLCSTDCFPHHTFWFFKAWQISKFSMIPKQTADWDMNSTILSLLLLHSPPTTLVTVPWIARRSCVPEPNGSQVWKPFTRMEFMKTTCGSSEGRPSSTNSTKPTVQQIPVNQNPERRSASGTVRWSFRTNSPWQIPKNGRPCFVYRINLVLIEESVVARDNKQYKIYRQDQVPGKLGLLVSSRLPEVALQTFHLFTISGKVLFQLEKIYEAVKWPSSFVDNRDLFNATRANNFDSLLSAQKFEPHLNWLAPRLKQRGNLESILC